MSHRQSPTYSPVFQTLSALAICLATPHCAAIGAEAEKLFNSYNWHAAELQNISYLQARTDAFNFGVFNELNNGTVKVSLLFWTIPPELEGRTSFTVKVRIPKHGWSSYLTGGYEFSYSMNKADEHNYSANITFQEGFDLIKAIDQSGLENTKDKMSLSAVNWSGTVPLQGGKEAFDWWIKNEKQSQR